MASSPCCIAAIAVVLVSVCQPSSSFRAFSLIQSMPVLEGCGRGLGGPVNIHTRTTSTVRKSDHHVSFPKARRKRSARCRMRRDNDSIEEGDGVDYSADRLTAFLGKFLPNSEKSDPPQAQDLVRSIIRRNMGMYARLCEAESVTAFGDPAMSCVRLCGHLIYRFDKYRPDTEGRCVVSPVFVFQSLR